MSARFDRAMSAAFHWTVVMGWAANVGLATIGVIDRSWPIVAVFGPAALVQCAWFAITLVRNIAEEYRAERDSLTGRGQ